ncbi:twin-arginine translocase subunit TatC [Thiospirillum jenense]|uniref:Sec-independent protein translocase protein TatC n=1 Tax=Thiospirillum jenense TaxID=1653858 RepID=A0A839HEY5_9GAMM|nr:twin-arginine translocase subunit TatC [Thiospirillum jenense]MBB1127221.1 twin-arginine translocase subunit TatC [Thiospirillum jenense]
MIWPFQSKKKPPPAAEDALEQTFISHLSELRDRIVRMVIAVIAVFFILFPFANDIYTVVAAPIIAKLPVGSTMIATQVASPFLTPIKLALITSIFLTMPYILYQLWGFVAPGLYRHEKRLAVPLLVSSIALFYIGMAFAYFVVFPFVFAFFAAVTPEGVSQMPDIAAYLDFVLALFLAFGVAFEIPIATVLLVAIGVTTPENLIEKRPYVIVGAFVVGMFLTPPDVVSQTLLALPMWWLYEAGVYFSRYFVTNPNENKTHALTPVNNPPPSAPITPPPPAPPVQTPVQSIDSFPDSWPADIDSEEAALDLADAEMAHLSLPPATPQSPANTSISTAAHANDLLLHQAHQLRLQGHLLPARQLLYQVLESGEPDQRRVARTILTELDQSI